MSEARVFGPTAIATPANALTLLRIVAAPVLVVLLIKVGPTAWWLWVLWTLLASTDAIDGVLARRLGTTTSGAFLDPLADKFLVLAAMYALAVDNVMGYLPVSLIAGREIAMSLFRVRASRAGISVPARPLAKLKTIAQDTAIGLALIPVVGKAHTGTVRIALWVALALTLVTGAEYLLDARRAARAVVKAGPVATQNAAFR